MIDYQNFTRYNKYFFKYIDLFYFFLHEHYNKCM
jgi:hypothetical protein